MGKEKHKRPKGKARKNNSNRHQVKSKIKSNPGPGAGKPPRPGGAGSLPVHSSYDFDEENSIADHFDFVDALDERVLALDPTEATVTSSSSSKPRPSPQYNGKGQKNRKKPPKRAIITDGRDPRLQDVNISVQDAEMLATILKETHDADQLALKYSEDVWESLPSNIAHLIELGFSESDALNSLIVSHNDPDVALEWLCLVILTLFKPQVVHVFNRCLHLDASRMPKAFAPRAAVIVEAISNADDGESDEENEVVQRLCEFGFDEDDVNDALEDNENDEIDALFQLLIDLDEEDKDEDEISEELDYEKLAMLKEQRDFEIEACKSIWDEEFKVESDSKITIKLPLDNVDGETIVEVHIADDCPYPEDLPFVAVRNSKLPGSITLKLNKEIVAELKQFKGQPVIFAISEFIKDRIQNEYFEHIKALSNLGRAQVPQEKPEPEKKGRRRRRGGRRGQKAGEDGEKEQKVIELSAETKAKIADIMKNGVPKSLLKAKKDKEGVRSPALDRQVSEYLPLTRNPQLDEKLSRLFADKKGKANYQRFQTVRGKLPAVSARQEVIHTIHSNQVILISGETGCGKTTQVGQMLLEEMIASKFGSLCNIICTQPRKLSAIAVAERVAEEMCEKIGTLVGYNVRLDSKQSSDTKMLFCTTGILLRRLQGDPNLNGVSHIIVDEVHERDINSDFLLVILKDLLPKRPDLKLILMSATLNSETFSKYFGNCPTIKIPGFTHPVKEHYLEDVVLEANYHLAPGSPYFKRATQSGKKKGVEYLASTMPGYPKWVYETLNVMQRSVINYELIEALVAKISTDYEEGGILIFLPGMQEIKRMCTQLEESNLLNPKKLRILPLHSTMSNSATPHLTQNPSLLMIDQHKIFDRPPTGIRKVVVATNIAETSITIDDIVFVIDSCRVKEMQHDPAKSLSSLVETWTSQSSSRQRRGRAGRVKPGHCFFFVTKPKMQTLPQFQTPEIQRAQLDDLCLQIVLLRLGKIDEFLRKALDPPNAKDIRDTVKNLREINAIDEDEELTPLGMHLARLPVSSSLGKMMIYGALLGCLDPVLVISSAIAHKSPFNSSFEDKDESDQVRAGFAGHHQSDLLSILNAYNEWIGLKGKDKFEFCRQNYLNVQSLQMMSDLIYQFKNLLNELGFDDDVANNRNSSNNKLVMAAITAGLYPNIAVIHTIIPPKDGVSGKFALYTKDRARVFVHPSSILANVKSYESKWMAFIEKVQTTKLFLRNCSVAHPLPLLLFGGELVMSRQRHILTVARWIGFNSNERSAVMINGLRRRLDVILQSKVEDPSRDLKGDRVINALVRLLTNERPLTF